MSQVVGYNVNFNPTMLDEFADHNHYHYSNGYTFSFKKRSDEYRVINRYLTNNTFKESVDNELKHRGGILDNDYNILHDLAQENCSPAIMSRLSHSLAPLGNNEKKLRLFLNNVTPVLARKTKSSEISTIAKEEKAKSNKTGAYIAGFALLAALATAGARIYGIPTQFLTNVTQLITPLY